MFCFLDTYKEAKDYAFKKRKLPPVNYCESRKKKKRQLRPTAQRKRIAGIAKNIRIKSERLTLLKKAIYILNRDSDKREIADLDVQEYNELFDDDDYTSPCTKKADPTQLPSNPDDECIVVETGNRVTQMIAATSEMIELKVDRDFSLEYSYSTTVR